MVQKTKIRTVVVPGVVDNRRTVELGSSLIAACPEVEDVVFSAQLMTGFGAFTLEEYKGNLNYFAAAVNDIAGVPGLKSEEIVRLYSRQCGRILLRRKGGGAAYAGGTVRPKFQHGYGTGTGRGGENGLYSGWKLACERNRRRGGFGIRFLRFGGRRDKIRTANLDLWRDVL